MERLLAGVCLALMVLSAAAQESASRLRMDYGLAAEVLKLDPAQAAAALDQNEQASATYQNAALQQHLAQEALRRGLTARYDVSRALHEAQQRVLILALRADVVRDVTRPGTNDLAQFYTNNVARWQYPDQYQADAVRMTNATPAVVEAVTKAMQETNWLQKIPTIATNAVIMTTASAGQWYGSNIVDQVIWQALGEMKDGAIKDVKVGDQTVIVRRVAFRKAGTLSFADVKDEVLPLWRSDREEKSWQDFVSKERNRIGI